MGKIVINEELCKSCGLCIETCPFHLIRVSKHLNVRGYHPAEFQDPEDKCTGCTLCALMCPDCVIEVYREASEDR